MRLTILHTNDIHGHLGQLPRIMTLIRRIRSQVMRAGGQVLLLDAGDSSDYYSPVSEISRGVANLRLLEAMGYTAATVGNWEGYAWGLSGLERMGKALHMPLLAANLARQDGQPIPGLKPYIWLGMGGWRVVVIGATVARLRHYSNAGIRVDPPEPLVRELATQLRSQGADLVIFLSHLGYGDAGLPGDLQLAHQPSDVDVIIGGHSHTALYQPVWIEETRILIAHAGRNGRFLGRVDLTLDDRSRRITSASGELIRVTPDVPADISIRSVLDEAYQATEHRLAQVIGQNAIDLPFTPDQESPWGNLVADVMRELAASDAAVILGVHLDRGLAAGPVTRAMVRAAVPDKAHIWVLELSGEQVRTLLARGLDPARMRQTGRIGGPGGDWRPVGLFHVSNMHLRYRPEAPDAERLVDVQIGGQPLNPARLYRIATLWWTFDPPRSQVADYVKLGPEQSPYFCRPDRMLWELLVEYIHRHSPLQPPLGGRIVAIA